MTIAHLQTTPTLKNALKPAGFKIDKTSIITATILINLLALALPIMTLQIYDRIIPNQGTGTLSILIFGVTLAVILEACLRLCRARMFAWSGASYDHQMSSNVIQKLLYSDNSKLSNLSVGEYLHQIGAISKMKDFYNGNLTSILTEILFIPLFFGFIIYIGGILAIIPATILILVGLTSLINGKYIRQKLKDREIEDDKRFNFLIEVLEGIHTIKSFALEKTFTRRYEFLEEKSTLKNHDVTQDTSSIYNTNTIFSNIMVLSIISVGAYLTLQGYLTTGALIATLLLSSRMMQPVQRAIMLWVKYQDYKITKHHIEQLLDTPQREYTNNQSAVKPNPDGRLELENLSYTHNGYQTPQLRDINLNLKRGDICLISGDSHSGKTTLLHLIAGILPTQNGTIKIDNEYITTYQPDKFMRHVGYIPSAPVIFRGTIRENITSFFQITEELARDIASHLKIDRDVAKLPSGYDTFLHGDSTDSLPIDLLQRITIARILAAKPRLILFDDADRKLDEEGYNLFYKLLAQLKGKATCIIVSNDQNIQNLADYHYKITNQKLVKHYQNEANQNVQSYRELQL